MKECLIGSANLLDAKDFLKKSFQKKIWGKEA